MNETEKEKIAKDILEITNRVKQYGRESEAVNIKVDIVLTGQEAINYKVMRVFSKSELSDKELVEMLFQLGVKNGSELVKIVATRHGIKT